MGSTTTSTSAPSTPPVDDSNLSIYQSALQRDLIVADLAALASLQTLLDTRTLTFFAPVNEAFEAVHPTILDYLRDPSNVLILREYLLGHVVSGEIPAATLSTYQNVTFESSQTSPITVDDNDDIFIGFSKILSGNIAATNGLIHLLDGIIGIPTLPQLLSRFGPFLLQILRATELVDQMDGKTLFGPSLFAFSGLSESFPNLTNAVLTDGAFVAHLTEILLAHAVPDILFGTDLEDGQNITMVNGDNYTISITNRTISLSPGTNNGIATVQGNAVTVQTIVYQTDGLLYPSFLEMTLVDVASGYTPMLASFLVIAELDDLLKNEFNMTGKSILILHLSLHFYSHRFYPSLCTQRCGFFRLEPGHPGLFSERIRKRDAAGYSFFSRRPWNICFDIPPVRRCKYEHSVTVQRG